ncbi:MAG: hypothetical protein ACYDB9_05640 [Gammaproteobacteria bacterium]
MADHLGFELPVTAPFRLDFTVAALQRWPQNALDQWDGQCYRRPLTFGTKPHEVCVSQRYASQTPTLDVEISAPHIAATARGNTISVLQHTHWACSSILRRSIGLRNAIHACWH